MEKTIQNTRAKAQQFFGTLTKGQRIRLFILISIVLLIAIFLYIYVSYKPFSVLYSGMDAADAGEVLSMLEEKGVDAKAQGTDTVLVRSDQVDGVRMDLASQGYPESGYNYDIFMKASGLGTTDYEKRIYLQFQLQDNLRQTIMKLDKVEDAVVNIILADDSSFVLSNDEDEASAAVMLTLKDGQTVNTDEVRAIAELVSKSVYGLSVDNVRVIDSQMKLYSLDDGDSTQNVGSQLELQQTVQSNLQEQILNLLIPIFGEDGVLVEVAVTLDFDTTITESVVFSPPVEGETEGLVVSMQQLVEIVQNNDGSTAAGTAGTSSNDGGTDTYAALMGENSDAAYKKLSTVANYELNQTKTQIESAKGQVKKLSVSVVLDSSAISTDYTDKIKNLMATAIGVSEENITVEALPFKQMEENGGAVEAVATQAELLKQVQKASLIRLIVIAVSSLFGLLLLVLVIRTLIKSKKAKPVQFEQQAQMEQESLQRDAEDFEFVTKEDGNLEKLGKYIDRSPESVANLLRTWLSEDYGR